MHEGPCKGLRFDNDRYWCSLVEAADGLHKEWLLDGLAIGAGCCAALNSDRQRMLVKAKEDK